MGLDHWLDGVKYKSAKNFNDNKRRVEKTLEKTWRKEWHFHDWFLLQSDDIYDCSGSFEISLNTLIKLRNICKKVLDNKSLATELLKDYYQEYDDYYWNSINDTYNILNELIEKDEYDWYEYSWWG